MRYHFVVCILLIIRRRSCAEAVNECGHSRTFRNASLITASHLTLCYPVLDVSQYLSSFLSICSFEQIFPTENFAQCLAHCIPNPNCNAFAYERNRQCSLCQLDLEEQQMSYALSDVFIVLEELAAFINGKQSSLIFF